MAKDYLTSKRLRVRPLSDQELPYHGMDNSSNAIVSECLLDFLLEISCKFYYRFHDFARV